MATWAKTKIWGKAEDSEDQVKEERPLCQYYWILYIRSVSFVILFFFGKQISLLFVDAGETEILHQAWMYLVGNSIFYIPLVLVNVMRFAIQGMGYSTFAIIAGVCEMVGRSWLAL